MSHERFESCIEACYRCAMACKHCSSADLEEPDVRMFARCIKLNGDCATVCILAAKMMAGGSEFSMQICELCADVCDACAAECERHEAAHCRECADACRKCAKECRVMSELPVE